MITTTATGTNVISYTITYSGCGPAKAPVSAKEARRLERIRLRHEKWRRESKERFKEEMRKIYAWSEANAWRPRVSSSGTGWGLSYWTLSASNEENEEVPMWRTIYNRYKNKGWLGITINNPSHREQRIVEAILAKIPKKNKIIEYGEDNGWKPYHDGDQHSYSPIGHFETVHMEIWFANLEDHNAVVAALDASPRFGYFMPLGTDDRNVKAVKDLLDKSNVNYRIVYGSEGIGIFMAEPGETNMVMMRLFGTQNIEKLL